MGKLKKLKVKQNKDFKSTITKVGYQKVKHNLVVLDFKQKQLSTVKEKNVAEQFIKQLGSSVSKSRRDAIYSIYEVIRKQPDVFLPSRSNYLINALFRSLHDDDYAVYSGAARVLNMIADSHFEIITQYRQLFAINLKLILNYSFMDNRRAFLEQLGENLAKMIDYNQIGDFALCLQDDFIAVKAVYILIYVLGARDANECLATTIRWQRQVGLISRELVLDKSNNEAFIEQLANVFKHHNIMYPISAATDTSYLQALLLLIYKLQENDLHLPQDFLHYLAMQFPYRPAEEQEKAKQTCFVLNGLLYLTTYLYQFEQQDYKRGQVFDIAKIMGTASEKQQYNAIEYLEGTVSVNDALGRNVLKWLLMRDFKHFKRYFGTLDTEDRVAVLLGSAEADVELAIAELSKLALRRQFDVAEKLATAIVRRLHEQAVAGAEVQLTRSYAVQKFKSVVIKDRVFCPGELMRYHCDEALMIRLNRLFGLGSDM